MSRAAHASMNVVAGIVCALQGHAIDQINGCCLYCGLGGPELKRPLRAVCRTLWGRIRLATYILANREP